jgi:hypothetical protein
MVTVSFTATVYNPDTEEVFNGWVDINWNRFELRTEQTDVRVHQFDTLAEAEEFVESEIGPADSYENGHWYAADSVMNNESGEDWSYCAYFE